MAEPIQIPFGLWARVGSRNHVLDGVQIPMGRYNFGERGRPLSDAVWVVYSRRPNRVLNGGSGSRRGRGNFWNGKGRLIVKYKGRSAVSCAKTAEPIALSHVDSKNNVLGRGADATTGRFTFR